MMMAYLKGADNRREASFAVRPVNKLRSAQPPAKVNQHNEGAKKA